MFKLDSLGNIIWQRIYGGDFSNVSFHISEIPGNKYIIVGWTQSFKQVIGGNDYDAFVMKIDNIGNVGSTCSIADYSLEQILDINITSFNTTSSVNFETTLTDNTDAVVMDSAAYVDTICSETIEQAEQKLLVDINVFPLNFDFGNQSIGTVSWKNFIIRNTGYNPLLICNINLSDSLEFSFYHNCPSYLDIAGMCEVTVVFDPNTVGQKSAYLYIESNDSGENLIEVSIIGTGVSQGECPPEICPVISDYYFLLLQPLLHRNHFLHSRRYLYLCNYNQ